ncbi:hypothetical protein [Jannaschia sp. R86511]|uniref:hypothetical protein n=1 Tax=Jannaschia sp. R86511 TaxID=3093853 RepID=UPI0036D263E2
MVRTVRAGVPDTFCEGGRGQSGTAARRRPLRVTANAAAPAGGTSCPARHPPPGPPSAQPSARTAGSSSRAATATPTPRPAPRPTTTSRPAPRRRARRSSGTRPPPCSTSCPTSAQYRAAWQEAVADGFRTAAVAGYQAAGAARWAAVWRPP